MANTFTWTAGASGSLESTGGNWAWISGSGSIAGPPNVGDTGIVTVGTADFVNDAALVSQTFAVAGISGAVAGLVFSGDTLVTFSNPTLDQNTLVESLVQGQTAAGQTLLDTAGIFVNQGTILANGPSGSSFTIDVTQGTSGIPGAFINEGGITVSAGNTLTIAAGPTAALVNASDIAVQGGSLLLTTLGAGALDGGVVPIDGVVVMSASATVEDNIAYTTAVAGFPPVFAFADSTDTLKLDQQAQFGGQILNFTAGDTINLGQGLTVNNTIFDSATGRLTLQDGSVTVSSLVFDGGAYSGGSFNTSTAANGDLLLTTTATVVSWVASSGAFGTGTNWSGTVVPGATNAVAIGLASNAGVITTAGSQSVRSLLLVGHQDTLSVGGSLGAGALTQGGGTIEVTAGATLGANFLMQIGGGGLQLDAGSQLNLAGVATTGFANLGTFTSSSGGIFGADLQGSGFINGGTLTSGGFIDIGQEGGGTPAQLTVTAAGTVTDSFAQLSSGPTSFGSLTLSGSAVAWTDQGSATDTANPSGYMVVGVNALGGQLPAAGAAGLTVTQGATLTEQSFAVIASSGQSSGDATVSNQGVWNIGSASGTGFLDVGNHGIGTLLITANGTVGAGGAVIVGDGGTAVAQGKTIVAGYGVDIGHHGGADGMVTIVGAVPLAARPQSRALLFGGQSGLVTSGNLIVGDAGNGTLVVQNSGSAVVTGSAGIVIGNSASGIGIAEISNSGVLRAAYGSLIVGLAGTGTLDVSYSGIAKANTVTINNLVSIGSFGVLDGSAGISLAASGEILGGGGGKVNYYGATGTVTNSGLIFATGGGLMVNGTLAGAGTLGIASGAYLEIAGSITGTDSFVFATIAAGSDLVLQTPGSVVSNAIGNFGAGDTIVLGNLTTITSAVFSGNDTTITVSGTTAAGAAATDILSNISLLAGTAPTLNIITVTDPINNLTTNAIDIPCFAAGTRLATPAGPRPVEALRPGDLVRTAGGALRPVRWIGHRGIDLTRHPDPRRAQPIRIRADAFADGVPSRDLLLSPDHAVFDRGRLVPIRLLVNGATILRETRRRRITYYHVELDSHDLLLAENLPAESYLDCDNRGIFENVAEPLILHPDFHDPAQAHAYRLAGSVAPLTDAPAEVAPLWWRLADRAVALGLPVPNPALTTDPALMVHTEAGPVAPHARRGAVWCFALPPGPATLVSRAAYPSDATPWLEDRRRLGVMVHGLTLRAGSTTLDLPLDHPALASGWWAPETDGVSRWRWTDGAARLPALGTPAMLEVTLGDTLAYPRRRRG